MVKAKVLVGTFLLTLGLAFIAPATPSFATSSVSNRPTISDLKSGIARLESVGEYQKLFVSGVTKLAASVPHADEYNYLHRLATTAERFISEYETARDNDLQELMDDINDAVIGCKLLIGTSSSTSSTTAATKSTATTTSSTAKPTIDANKTTSLATTAKTIANTASAIAPVASVAASQPTATTPSPEVATTLTVTVTEPESDSAVVNDTETDIEIPATGEVETPVSFGGLAALGAVIVGGAAISVGLTLAIHHQPRRHHARRRF